MPEPVLLLPPSEGKAEGGRRRGRARVPRAFPELDAARAEVIHALEAAMADRERAGGLLGVKGAALDAAIAANLDLRSGPVLPAIARYSGVLYDHLHAASLAAGARQRLERRTLVVSGLWGLVRPDDPLPDYKLKVDAALPPLGRMGTWWRPRLTPVLDALTDGAVVWDLLPGAHARVWADPDRAPATRVTVAFAAEQRRGGRTVRTAVTHWSKALKGALARHLLSSGAPAAHHDAVAEVLAGFHHERGYVLERVEADGTHLHASFLAPLAPPA